MSRENVEVSRRMWDRFLARDIPGTIAFLDPEVEIHDMPQVPDARVYHGHTGWQTQIERFNEAFTNLSYRLLECIDCGENVVSVIHASGTGAGSGIPAEVTYAQVETWRDEKVVSMRYFMSKEEALETVGLRE